MNITASKKQAPKNPQLFQTKLLALIYLFAVQDNSDIVFKFEAVNTSAM